MTEYTHRRIVIVPAAQRATVNTALESLSWGPDNLALPCISEASLMSASPTHYCCDVACTAQMLADLQLIVSKAGGVVQDEGPVSVTGRLNKVLTEQKLKRKDIG